MQVIHSIHIHIWHKPYPFESYSCLALTFTCICNMLAVNYESSVLSRNLEVLVMRTSKNGVCFRFVGHFWDCLSPGSLGKDVTDAFYLRRKCCCRFGINFHDTKFGIYSCTAIWQTWFLKEFKKPSSLLGPFLNNTLLENVSKKITGWNNRKCLEITEESLLLHCRNSQHPKVNRCCFNYIKNGLLRLQFSPPSAEALCFVSAGLPDFKAMSPVTSALCKA